MAENKPRSDQKVYGPYIKSLLTTKVVLAINEVGQNIKQNLEKKISAKVEGKCSIEGFIQPKSVNVKTYSNGLVNTGFVEFQVVFECMVCRPVEGMLIKCMVKTITKAGIHAEYRGKHGEVPITAHIARDHNYNDLRFNNVKENNEILVKVIGVRFELNDPCIDIIGKVVEPTTTTQKQPKKALKIGGYLDNHFVESVPDSSSYSGGDDYMSSDNEDLP
jgi:DNA-directed RNA polymerase subunit E'/Rpb7